MKQELYKELTKPEFKRGSEFYTDDLGEGTYLAMPGDAPGPATPPIPHM